MRGKTRRHRELWNIKKHSEKSETGFDHLADLLSLKDVKAGSWSYNQQAKVIKWFEMNRSAWSQSEQLQTAIINVFRTVLFVNWQRLTWAKSKDNESKKNAASESDLSRIITSQTYIVIEVLKTVLIVFCQRLSRARRNHATVRGFE